MHCIHTVDDKRSLVGYVKTIANLWVPYKAKNLSLIWTTICVSGRILLYYGC
jgi:hypothetical protein